MTFPCVDVVMCPPAGGRSLDQAPVWPWALASSLMFCSARSPTLRESSLFTILGLLHQKTLEDMLFLGYEQLSQPG